MVPIVLTGTIITNTIKVTHCDWKKRRSEYLDAIRYYKKFSKVYFLENSHYDLSHDGEFSTDEKFQCLKFEASKEFERGKGYQEFQMLDEFVKHNLNEDCFIKVTGRYIYKNFGDLFPFVLSNKDKYDLIIDAYIRTKWAHTSLFYVKKKVYMARLQGSYLEMDDSERITYAERVIYSALKDVGSYTFFPKAPIFDPNVISGTTGLKFATYNYYYAKVRIRGLEKILFRLLGAKRLL